MENKKFKWWHVAVVISAVFVGLYGVLIRPVNWDEMHYVDPGAQLFLQGKMVSTVWVSNSPNELWASSNPGMPLLFAGWFKVFGFGFVQSRTLFFSLHLLGVWAFFAWIRNKFNPSPWALVLGVAGCFILPSLAEPITIFRLEVLSLLLFTLFLHYTWTEKENIFLNWVAPVFLGLLTILFGLHFTGFFLLAAAVAFLLKRDRVMFVKGIALVVGIIIGLLVLRETYKYLNVWDTFINARTSHHGRTLSWCPVGLKKLTVTFEWPLLLSVAVLGLIGSLKKKKWVPWALAILGFFAIPFIISSIGLYYRSYIWMVSLPMILCFYSGEILLKGWARSLNTIIITISLTCFALHNFFLLKRMHNDTEQKNQVITLIEQRFSNGSSIVAPPQFYYNFTGSGFKYYPRAGASDGEWLGFNRDFFFPKNLRNEVKCIIIPEKETSITSVISDMDGKWTPISNFPAPANSYKCTNFRVFIRAE